ncbi:hypothetical protein [Palleronia pelagia]|uniref:Uncharacterized protein n=1 Tax=Palleronia pelagia TaxID=387096 RepID=A0A1H8HWG7_9RHOB|nr:hypothetical protein [Palleronia pelagia]SEN60730.1 hypothetical protein SAMN04488011_10532 [Palleronia pelagia]
MPGRDTQYQALAREAAERLDHDQDLVKQLSLLPDEQDSGAADQGDRPTRGKGKQLSQLREFLAAKGYRLPEQQLAEIAGLTTGKDAIATAMEQAERILSWARHGAEPDELKDGTIKRDRVSLAKRLEVFQQCYTAQLRAADALMPYGAPKVTPDVHVTQPVAIFTAPQPTGDRADRARDVTPASRRMMPADVAHEMQRNQQVSESDVEVTDGEGRTE